jgi:hypothetical protein
VGAALNSEGFRDSFLRNGRKTQGAKMAGKKEAAEGTGSPCDLGSRISGRKTESYLETTGDLAPVYQKEGVQGREGLSRSEKRHGIRQRNDAYDSDAEHNHKD